MITIQLEETILSHRDSREAFDGTSRPHPLELLLEEAKRRGFKIEKMDIIQVKPEAGELYTAPAVLLFGNEMQGRAVIICRKMDITLGYSYGLYTYLEVRK